VTYRLLLEAGWTGSPDLKVLCGGEALPAALAEQLLARCHSLWNLYGPTETTIWSAASQVQPGAAISIGRPLANTQLYVLDARQQPVPVGVPGELYIGGAGLARGYLHQPDLTREKFLPDPFQTGGRMYRTGDLVRRLPDGSLQFLQRVDNQVKVRGYRIELGEIETVLARHEAIAQAVAMITESSAGEPELAAYLISHAASPPSTWELREYLNAFLPTYMVPAVFGWVQEFPLTPSGKVDRKKLLDVPLDKALLRPGYPTAPRDPMEKELVAIWESVLNYHPIGIHDSFFELGGHSLLMVQLIHAIKKRFGHEVPMLFFMQNPTVEALAVLLRKEIDFQRPDHALVPLQPKGGNLPLYLVHAVGGNVYSYTELIRYIGEEQPVYGLQMVHFDPQKAPSTLYDMASGYLDEILEQQPEGPFVLGGYSFGGNLAYEMAVQLQERGHEVQRLILFDTVLAAQKPDAPLDDDTLEVMYLQRFEQQERTLHLLITPDELLAMPREKRLRYLLQITKMNGFIPPDAEIPELLNALYAWSINVKALLEYEPRPAPVPITFFMTESTGAHVVQEWEALTSRELEVTLVSGTHYTMMRHPHILQVLEPIRGIMKLAEGRQKTR
jgi:thioesterase domain-containing protein/acyl carrier protein